MNPEQSNNDDNHSYPHLYPFALVPLGELQNHIRAHCTDSEGRRLPALVEEWKAVQETVATVLRAESEAAVADSNSIEPVPEEFRDRIAEIATHPAFPKTFGFVQTSFGIVEIDRLVATQRIVNVEHVNKLVKQLPETPSMEELIDFCLGPARNLEPPQHLEVAPNSHVFSSRNADLRFLGSFLKPLEPNDIHYAVLGGIPAAVVISLIGFGLTCANVFKIGNRLALNNGFHRLCALRTRGVTRVPVVVQHVANPQLELPPQVVNLPRDYVIRAPRPVLMKDFFDSRFTRTFNVRRRLKTVNINVGISQYDVPA